MYRTVRLWDANSGKEIRSFNGAGIISSLAFSPTGDVLAAGMAGDYSTGFVQLWDTATGKELCRHSGHREEAAGRLLSPRMGSSSLPGRDQLAAEQFRAYLGRRRPAGCDPSFRGPSQLHRQRGFLAERSDGGQRRRRFDDSVVGHHRPARCGRSLACQAADTDSQLDACWTALANEDAAKAYDAVWALVASPEQAPSLLDGEHCPGTASRCPISSPG